MVDIFWKMKLISYVHLPQGLLYIIGLIFNPRSKCNMAQIVLSGQEALNASAVAIEGHWACSLVHVTDFSLCHFVLKYKLWLIIHVFYTWLKSICTYKAIVEAEIMMLHQDGYWTFRFMTGEWFCWVIFCGMDYPIIFTAFFIEVWAHTENKSYCGNNMEFVAKL